MTEAGLFEVCGCGREGIWWCRICLQVFCDTCTPQPACLNRWHDYGAL